MSKRGLKELRRTEIVVEETEKELISEFLEDLKEIAIMINNHELARMKVEKWEKRL